MISLATCLLAGAVALPGSAASHSPVAGLAKKCEKRKHHHRKGHCKRPMAVPASIAISGGKRFLDRRERLHGLAPCRRELPNRRSRGH